MSIQGGEVYRPTWVVLGGFLASEYHVAWQRQQEFVSLMMREANIIYVERAAPGTITPGRVAGRLGKVLTAWRPVDVSTGFPDSPVFLKWVQPPLSGDRWWRAAAQGIVRKTYAVAGERGWSAPSLVVLGTPTEVWRHALEGFGLPYWYDLYERVLESRTYRTTSRPDMLWIAEHATLMTCDTEIGRGDWTSVRDDILVVPHGAREWGQPPLEGERRDALYYVGSMHRTLDVELLDAIAAGANVPVRIIGSDPEGRAAGSVEVCGWRPAGTIVRALSDAIAGLVPYRVDAFGEAVYPTKVYDYMLAGAPVLSTRLPALELVPHVRLCDTPNDFVDAAAWATDLTVDDRAAIRAYALENGWSSRWRVVRERLVARAEEAFR